ncbi:MAG: polysaccharide deacetylase family protein [Candidatus Acidiferrum sp.]
MRHVLRWLLLAVLLLHLVAPLCAQTTGSDAKTIAERLGYPGNAKLLVIHADDFGMTHSVDAAIEEALENHWVSSASILVPCPWFPEVAQWAKAHPDADLGIHLALNSEWTTYRWGPVSAQPRDSSLRDPDGYLPLTSEYVNAHAKMPEVEAELHAQVDKAKAAGIRISHLDTHMGSLAGSEDLFRVYVGMSRAYHTPLLVSREFNLYHTQLDPGTIVLDSVLQIAPGVPKGEWLSAYEKMLRPLAPGIYELIVHLAHNDSDIQAATADHPDWGAQWRQNDFDLVRSAEFQQFLKAQGFILISWSDLRKAAR